MNTNETILNKKFESLKSSFDAQNELYAYAINGMFLIFCSCWLFIMQVGFVLLEAGSVRTKNTTHILFTNFFDIAIGTLGYWAVGFGLAFGSSANAFAGHSNFFLMDAQQPQQKGVFSFWLFEMFFAATAATIVSGAVAERTTLVAYFSYTILLSTIIFPIGSHWVWSSNGTNWLALQGFNDFAGSAVVHLVGGTASLIGVLFAGPRIGRFNKQTGVVNTLAGHSNALVVIGGCFIWVGFLAFNGGSNLKIVGSTNDETIISLAIVNTMLASSSAGVMAALLSVLINKKWSLLMCVNGMLIGAVSICAGCNAVPTWAATVIGLIAGAIYVASSLAVLKLQLDDPLDSISVHMMGGLWGVVAAGLFASSELVSYGGVFMDGDWKCLGWNCLGAIIFMAWTAIWMVPMFWLLSALGLLRVSSEVENKGLDSHYHGEWAYPETRAQELMTKEHDELLKPKLEIDSSEDASNTLHV